MRVFVWEGGMRMDAAALIRRLAESARRPVVAGGLIEEKEDVVAALAAGAVAGSATNPAVWDM